MRCPLCQHENPSGAKFCNSCGARLEFVCPACQHVNVAGSRFCNSCWRALEDAVTLRPATKFTSPEAYTPKHLAEKILTSKSGLEGERKQVTVLFADMKGSMELLADRDPEDARKMLDPVLEHMMEAVHRYEGTVNQVMGDGIMALFGAPLAHEDHAVRACYAALRMQESVKKYAEQVQRTEGIPIQIRVGLNSGEVVVRSIGSDLKMDYTAVGQTTHMAARMEQMAMPGSIMMTADALRLAEGYVLVKPLGPVHIKGMSEQAEIYEITGSGPTRTRLQAAAARGLTRFVGRNAELEALGLALERARAGHGQVVALVGEPGVGKSRLFWEFSRSHRTQGWLLLESGSVSYGKATSYLPVIDLLKAYFQIEAGDDGRKICEKVTGKLLTLDEAFKSTLPAFLTLLEVPVDDTAWQTLDPPQRRHRTLDAVKRLLLRESQVQPLLLAFEDLHWIDSETQAVLDGLVESLPTARLLLLVNYRPEYQHGWGSKTYYTQARLDPLPAESADDFLQAILGEDPTLQPLKQLLIARTEGNPFFLEESVRTLVETKVLAGKPGAYRPAKELDAIQVPATVQAVLAARIDRLPPEEKQLLQSAAVIGKDVPFVLLQAIAELTEETLRQRLTHLQAAEFLYETSLFPDLDYTFKHALTHEVAYGSVLQERRRALHAAIVDAIERLFSDRVSDHVEWLAHHAFRGQVWDKAVTYLRQAGAKAASRSAHREAETYFEQALEAVNHLPKSRETIEQAIDLRLELRNSLLPLGEFQRLLDHLRQAETLAEAVDDERRLGRVSCYMTQYHWVAGEYDRAIVPGERALALGDFAVQVETNFYLGAAYHALGNYSRAIELLKANVESLQGNRLHERLGLPFLPSVTSRTWLVRCLAELGEFPEAIARGAEAVPIAETVDHPFSLVDAYWAVGHPYLHKGDFQTAIPILERALEICQVWHIPLLFPWVGAFLGHAYALCRRPAEGLPLLEEVAERAASIGLITNHSYRLTLLGEAYLLAGRTDDAIQHAEHALELSCKHKERGHQAWALRLLGEIAARSDPPGVEKAETYYRQAMAQADELGMRPLMARCHLGLGKLYRTTGKRQQAQEHLTTATAMMRDMQMGLWLEKAETELKELR